MQMAAYRENPVSESEPESESSSESGSEESGSEWGGGGHKFLTSKHACMRQAVGCVGY